MAGGRIAGCFWEEGKDELNKVVRVVLNRIN